MIDVTALWFGGWLYAIAISVWAWSKNSFEPWLEKRVKENRQHGAELLGGDWQTTDGELVIKDGRALRPIKKGTILWIAGYLK